MSENQLLAKKEQLSRETAFASAKSRKLDYLIRLSRQRPSYELFSLDDEARSAEDSFLLSPPGIPYDLNALRDAGIQYVVVTRLWKKDQHLPFYERLDHNGKLLHAFNPYPSGRAWPYEHPLTGAPFLLKDLLERSRNGQPLKVYKL